MTTDHELLDRWIREQDAEAFHEIATRYSGLVYATCDRVLKNSSDAEEVTQECFERLAFHLSRPVDRLGAWLHRVATNLALSRIRGERRRRERETRFARAKAGESASDSSELLEHVDAVLEELPSRLREALVLHFLEGRTHDDIARSLSVSRGTVTNRIRRGIEALRKKLTRRGLALAGSALGAWLGDNLTASEPPASLTRTLGRLALGGVGRSRRPAVGRSGVASRLQVAAAISAACIVAIGLTFLWRFANESDSGLVDGVVENSDGEAVASVPATEAIDGEVVLAPTPRDAAAQTAEPTPERAGENVVIPAAIRGAAYVEETGEPLPNIEVLLETEGNRAQVKRVVTDEDGRYLFQDLAAGTYVVKRPSFVDGLPRFSKQDAIRVQLSEEDVLEDVDLPTFFGIRVSGRVVDPGGQPIPEAQVEGRDRAANTLLVAQSRADGRFDLLGSRQTSAFTLEAFHHKTGMVSDLHTLTLGAEDVDDFTVTVYPAATLAGTVVDSEGRPVAGAVVAPNPRVGDVPRYLAATRGRSDESGLFKIRRMARGTYEIWIRLEDSSPSLAEPPWDRFEIDSGEVLEDVTLVLAAEVEEEVALSGRVLDSRAQAVEGAEVDVRGDNRTIAWARSATDGRFRASLPVVEVDALQVTVKHDRFANRVTEFRPGDDEELTIVLEDGITVGGRVLDASSGEPIRAFELLYVDRDNRNRVGVRRRFERYREDGGRFLVHGLEPGRIEFIARAPGYSESTVEIEDASLGAEPETVEIRLQAALSLSGIVTDKHGAPIVNAGIVLGEVSRYESLESLAVTRTDENGEFDLLEISVDTRKVTVFHAAYAPATKQMFRPLTAESRISIQLARGGIIEGTVYLADQPWIGQELEMRSGSRWKTVGKTDSEGRFRLDHVEPGSALLRVGGFDERTPDTTRYIQRSLKIVDEEVTRQDFHFEDGDATLRGTVTLDGQPESRCSVVVHVSAKPSSEYRYAFPGSDGRYELEYLPAGAAKLTVSLNKSPRTKTIELTIEAGEPTIQDVDFVGGRGSP